MYLHMYSCFAISGFYFLKNSTSLHSSLRSASVYFEECWQIQTAMGLHPQSWSGTFLFTLECSIRVHPSLRPHPTNSPAEVACLLPHHIEIICWPTAIQPGLLLLSHTVEFTLSVYSLCALAHSCVATITGTLHTHWPATHPYFIRQEHFHYIWI